MPVLALGTVASIVLFGAAVAVIWPQLKPSSAPNVNSIDGTSLLHVGALDFSMVTARLSGVDIGSTDELRRAGVFVVTLVDGKLVPVDTNEPGEFPLEDLLSENGRAEHDSK